MSFSQLTHLLMCLSLETLRSIIRTAQPILVELTDLVNFVIIFVSQTTLLQLLNFLLASLTVTLTVLLLWIYLYLDASIFLQWLSLHWEILIILWSQFLLAFHQTQNGMSYFMV